MTHAQVFAQSVYRERGAHQIGQPNHQRLQRAQILYAFQAADVVLDQPRPVLARPSARPVHRAAQPGFGESAEIEKPAQPVGVGDGQLGDRQRVQTQMVVAALQGVSAVAVVIEPTATGDENPHSVLTVVEPLEPTAPPVELVQLVEDEYFGGRQTPAQDRVPVLGDVPVQVSRRVRENLAREGGLPNLPRAGDEHHLSFQIASDLFRQIACEVGGHARILSFSCPCKKIRCHFCFPVNISSVPVLTGVWKRLRRLRVHRFNELLERYGMDTVLTATGQLMDYTERVLRQRIAEISDGEYRAEGLHLQPQLPGRGRGAVLPDQPRHRPHLQGARSGAADSNPPVWK